MTARAPAEAATVDVVALHGGFTTAALDWAPLEPLLDPRLSLTCPPLRGHPGGSLPPGEPVGPATIAEDTVALVRERGLDAPVLAGFSLGARAAMLAAVDGSSPSALVLLGPRFEAFSADEFERLIALALRHTPGWDGPESAAALDAMRAGIVDFGIQPEEWGARLGDVPVLAVRGVRDRICSPEGHERFAEVCSHARVVTLEGRGHRVQDGDPAPVAEVINDFLADCGVL